MPKAWQSKPDVGKGKDTHCNGRDYFPTPPMHQEPRPAQAIKATSEAERKDDHTLPKGCDEEHMYALVLTNIKSGQTSETAALE